jgi:pimeloyl-ACP methyl ester carboxylesterase
MPFIETSGKTTLCCNDRAPRDAETSPVVLIHGWPLDDDMWEYQSGFLASQGLRVITCDRRGFGRSSQPWTGYDYDTLADDQRTVLDRLELTGVTLAGFSMGGGEVARHNGARIARTVLVSAVTPLLQTPTNPDGVDKTVFDQMAEGLQQDRPNFLAASMIRGAQLKVYDGAPHALFFTGKDHLNQDLLAFITVNRPNSTRP